jgi:hypothetical protein
VTFAQVPNFVRVSGQEARRFTVNAFELITSRRDAGPTFINASASDFHAGRVDVRG